MFVWSLIGSIAAFKPGIREDMGLLAAGIVGATLIILRDRLASKPAGADRIAGTQVHDVHIQ